MTADLDERFLDAVNSIGPTSWSGRCFRYTSARRDPLSGEGARLHGGRWNPPDLFPVIYLGIPERACMTELEKAARDNHLDVAAQLQVPYVFHTIVVNDIPVLDLRDRDNRHALGLDTDDLTGSWKNCQPFGHAAWFLEFAGVLAPSATADDGLTLALFEHRVLPAQLQVQASEPLTIDLFRAHLG